MIAPSSIETCPDLREACGLALKCHERSLFYADNVSVDPLGVILKDDPPILFITRLYSECGEMLLRRLRHVSERYVNRRLGRFSSLTMMGIVDRDYRSVVASREILSRRFKILSFQIVARSNSKNPPFDITNKHQIDEYKQDWRSLETMCLLVMDEISFLSRRIDDFENSRRSIKGLRWSALGVIASVLVAVLSLTRGKLWDISDALDKAAKHTKQISQKLDRLLNTQH